jgi:hypothetical protein
MSTYEHLVPECGTLHGVETYRFIQHLPREKQAMEIVWSAARLQAESLSWWFGLRKCIRPVCGDKLLAIMESAHR